MPLLFNNNLLENIFLVAYQMGKGATIFALTLSNAQGVKNNSKLRCGLMLPLSSIF